MYIKFIWVSIFILVILQDANGKKSKKKRIDLKATEPTPQPNVLTYSTFGFNDVGTYDGFVPSSPDFANYLTKTQESSTRLYAPAFPSAPETTGLGSYYDPQMESGPFSVSSDINESGKPYEQVSIKFFTSPNHDINTDQGNTVEAKEEYNFNTDDINSPIYGTKITSKSKNKHFNNYNNNTGFNIFDSVSSVINRDAGRTKNINNNFPTLPSAPSTTEDDKIVTISSPISTSSLKFPKFVDFTSVKKYYPTSVENKYQESMQRPIVLDRLQNNEGNSNFNSFQSNTINENKEEQSHKNKINYVGEHPKQDKKFSDINSFNNDDWSNSYNNLNNNIKNNRFKNDKTTTKTKIKPWNINNSNNNKNKDGRNPVNGYEYSTNYSTTSFKFDYDTHKRPFNSSIDEISPASSNLDFVDYQFPDKDFSSFKNVQNIKPSNDFDTQSIFPSNYRDKHKPSEEYLNSFKNLYSTDPTSTSQWGNIFKNTEFSSYKNHPRKPNYNEESNDEIVHIPKKEQSYKYGKYFDTKLSDLSLSNTYKPFKMNDNKPEYEWPKDFFNTGFKSEEELLGLRNHDTSHPYFKPNYDLAEEFDYKKLAQKWKQNYLRSKYRDSNREYETYASDTKPIHVPLPKPYPIEVPHPVIIPVPQPYPVKVPIPKPVAVPVIRELTVPIEKPVPYPVIKKVPYPIEKPVPVPVEKQVQVPVIKPYPVHIPQIRPIFHHTKPHDDRESDIDEDEYVPRPDTKRPIYKRPKNSHSRHRPPSRRPTRMSYQDRNRKRVPNKRPTYYDQRPRRPHYSENRPQRYREDFDDFDSDSEFDVYCKRTGRC